MMFALATAGWGLPQVAGVAVALVIAVRRRRLAPRAARWALAAAIIELILVAGDLALLGSADLLHSLTYVTVQRLNTLSDVLMLLAVLTLAPLLYAMVLDRGLRLPALPRRGGLPPTAIPPGTRQRWQQVLPRRGDEPPPRG